MKALTIWQPWASLIAIGAKPYEFRGWKPPARLIGQRIAIHAGKRPMRKTEIRALSRGLLGVAGSTNPCLRRDVALPFVQSVLREEGGLFEQEMVEVPYSALVATAIVGEAKSGDVVAREFGVEIAPALEGDSFNWGWPLIDIRPLGPSLPCAGAQGLWTPPYGDAEIAAHEGALSQLFLESSV